ncbi:hypothetical protein LXL04_025174 [Taraxacum kok-saghyz]
MDSGLILCVHCSFPKCSSVTQMTEKGGIDFSKVPARRWRKKCYVCRKTNGCAIDCSEENCGLSFHVTCGLKEDLCIEYKEGRNSGAIVAGFCKSHTDLWTKVMHNTF